MTTDNTDICDSTTCGKYCEEHAEILAEHNLDTKRIEELEKIVKEIPRMQARVHMLMCILIATMTILISISGFSFLQLVDFKKSYFADRQKHTERHSDETLEQEQRYITLINGLGNRVGTLEARNLFNKTE